MKFILSAHNIKVTQGIVDHILDRLNRMDHLDPWLIDARVTIEHDTTKDVEKKFKCAIRLSVRGRDLFAEDLENDLYAAIDLVAKKIEQQIRKRHGKTKDRKHSEVARRKARLKGNLD